MLDASLPGSLGPIGKMVCQEGALGLLISGGCDKEGRVPLIERIGEIGSLKEMGLLLNVHTGHVDEAEVETLVNTGIDRFSVDLHRSADVIKNVLHQNGGKERYEATLRALCRKAPGRVVPHICAGLDGDQVLYEKECVDMAMEHEIAALVLIRHMPTKASQLHLAEQLSDERFYELVEHAVDRSDVPVLLGCMRPRGSGQVELECARRGIAGIANLRSDTEKILCEDGFTIERRSLCCALHR
jgi:uncharacterized radical SAM superfamily protein